MARDVVRRVAGINRDEVLSMLGDPNEQCDALADDRLVGAEVYAYYIGSGEGGYDDAYVYVHFDSKGEVIHAQITGF